MCIIPEYSSQLWGSSRVANGRSVYMLSSSHLQLCYKYIYVYVYWKSKRSENSGSLVDRSLFLWSYTTNYKIDLLAQTSRLKNTVLLDIPINIGYKRGIQQRKCILKKHSTTSSR